LSSCRSFAGCWSQPSGVLPALTASFSSRLLRCRGAATIVANTGFAVLRVKARGRRDLATLVGHAASISAGEYIHAVGVWLTDRTHGLQFKADVFKTTPPTTKEGMARYLGSGMVRGIGPPSRGLTPRVHRYLPRPLPPALVRRAAGRGPSYGPPGQPAACSKQVVPIARRSRSQVPRQGIQVNTHLS